MFVLLDIIIPRNATVLNAPTNVKPVNPMINVLLAQLELTEISNLPQFALVNQDIMKMIKNVLNVLTNVKPVNLLQLVLNVKKTETKNQIVIVTKDIGKMVKNVKNVQSSVKLVLLLTNVTLVPPN